MLERLIWSSPHNSVGIARAEAGADGFVDARRCTVQMSNGFLYLDAVAGPATALLGYDEPPCVDADPQDVVELLNSLNPDYRCVALTVDHDTAAALAVRVATDIAGNTDRVSLADANAAAPTQDVAVLIANERDTIGRTGTWLASDKWERKPDVIVFGETLSAGWPFGAVLARSGISEQAARGLASIQFEEIDFNTLNRVAGVVQALNSGLLTDGAELVQYLRERISSVRETCFEIASIEFSAVGAQIAFKAPIKAADMKRKMCERGVLVGLNGNTILIAPLLPTRLVEIDVICGSLRASLTNMPAWRPAVCCLGCQREASEYLAT